MVLCLLNDCTTETGNVISEKNCLLHVSILFYMFKILPYELLGLVIQLHYEVIYTLVSAVFVIQIHVCATCSSMNKIFLYASFTSSTR